MGTRKTDGLACAWCKYHNPKSRQLLQVEQPSAKLHSRNKDASLGRHHHALMSSFGIAQRAHVRPIPCRKPILTLVLVSSVLLPAPPQLSQVPLPISRNHPPAGSRDPVSCTANPSQRVLLSRASPSPPPPWTLSLLLATHLHSSLFAVPRHSR